jgi:hypothetical protein
MHYYEKLMYAERTMICDVMVNMLSQFMISGNFTALAHCAKFGKPRGRLFVPFFPSL